ANTYGPAARKAWLGLVKYLDKDGNVSNVCIGTNKAKQEVGADPAVQLKFYLDRGRRTGDLHGQAALMWCASALLRQRQASSLTWRCASRHRPRAGALP